MNSIGIEMEGTHGLHSQMTSGKHGYDGSCGLACLSVAYSVSIEMSGQAYDDACGV